MNTNNWKLIWSKKTAKSFDLQDLIVANGYASHTKINEENYSNFLNHVLKKLGASKNESIFEVGCGAGAALKIFKEYDMIVIEANDSKKFKIYMRMAHKFGSDKTIESDGNTIYILRKGINNKEVTTTYSKFKK